MAEYDGQKHDGEQHDLDDSLPDAIGMCGTAVGTLVLAAASPVFDVRDNPGENEWRDHREQPRVIISVDVSAAGDFGAVAPGESEDVFPLYPVLKHSVEGLGRTQGDEEEYQARAA